MKKVSAYILILIGIISLLALNARYQSHNSSLNTDNQVLKKITHTSNTQSAKYSLLTFHHYKATITTMEGTKNKKFKGVTYVFFLYSKNQINANDLKFELINTPLKNPYTIEPLCFFQEVENGYLYELKISTMYDYFYSEKQLNDLKDNPGFNIILKNREVKDIIF